LRQGNHQVVEMSYQRTKDFDRLSFLYLISGDSEKLKKMLKISTMRQDIMGRYHNALLLGDAAERVKVLDDSGNRALAYISAKLHGLEDEAARIQIAIETNGGTIDGLMDKVQADKCGKLLQPPTPIIRANNWATVNVPKTTLEDLSADEHETTDPAAAATDIATPAYEDGAADWEDDFGATTGAGGAGAAAGVASALDDLDLGDDDGMGDWDDDLDLGDEDDIIGDEEKHNDDDMDDMAVLSSVIGTEQYKMPTAGRPAVGCWVQNSSHAADHMAAGGAASALQLLNRQIAASDFSLMRDAMLGSYIGSTMSMPGVPGSTSMNVPLLRNDTTQHPGNESLPRLSIRTVHLVQGIRSGYRFFQGGKFNDSLAAFQKVLLDIPLVGTTERNEGNEIKEMLEICREYITAIRIKAVMAAHAKDPKRSTELSAYFTHCNLQPVHLLLALRSAMGTAFKHKNYIFAASFSRRLLELPDMSSERNADLRVKAMKVLQKSEQMARNEHTIDYDESTAFQIDCESFTPIYSNGNAADTVQCSYCGSNYAVSRTGKSCLTCHISTVGVKTLGLVTGS